ncbi:MAG: hypothetical protein DRN15_10080 [Thermoprotei archaeon]|nr:MAG: hypothetical protein DRN15_10080 [Thermoprotei archaeon]RLF25528.1 MAG: hypothetical protein DRM97_01460 [Thermoprotei archaeon]
MGIFFSIAMKGPEGKLSMWPRWKRYHVEEKPEEYIVYVELPGVKKEDIELYASDHMIFVRAKSSIKLPSSPEAIELPIRLEDSIDVDAVHAKYENGLLTVRAPKRGARRIPIS